MVDRHLGLCLKPSESIALNDLPRLHAMPILPHLALDLNIQSTKSVDDFQPYVPVTRTLWTPDHCSGVPPNTCWHAWVWYPLVSVTILCATLTAIGGTMMQIIGVCRDCLCDIPITVWHRRYENELLVINTNSADDIHRVTSVWTGTGVTVVVFLGFASFVRWWYQKQLGHQFKQIIMEIDKTTEEQMQLLNGYPHVFD